MVDRELVRRLMSLEVHDREGAKVGRISQVYLDDESGQPEFVTVGLSGVTTREAFVVLAGAHDEGDRLVVPWTRDEIHAAPTVAVHGGGISPADRDALLHHYGVRHVDAKR